MLHHKKKKTIYAGLNFTSESSVSHLNFNTGIYIYIYTGFNN